MTTAEACPRCDQVHERCKAHTRAGKPCRRKPMIDQEVCDFHGGKAPQALAAVERRIKEREALVAARTFGLPVDVDPAEALLEELHRTAGEVAWLGSQVAALSIEDAVWGDTEEVEKRSGEFPGTDTTRAAKPSVWVQLWHQQRRHLADVARECLKAGIEERRVRLAESQGLMLAGVIRAVLNRLNLTDEQQLLVPTVVPEELRRAAPALPPGGPTT